MNLEKDLQSCLLAWDEVYAARMDEKAGEEFHLSPEKLYRMAEQDGIKESGHEALEHLSRCPVCQREWAAWLKAVSDVHALDDFKEEESFSMTFGMLKAAATPKQKEPLNIRSACGRFILGLLPQIDNPDRGMLTLEAVDSEAGAMQGLHVIVRDRNGLILLKGKLHHGRLARTFDKLSEIDLSTWTLVFDETASG